MWIAKKEFNALKERIESLEGIIRNQYGTDAVTFTVYKDMPPGYWNFSFSHFPPNQKVSVKDAIEKIMAHLGMKLTYVEGVPTTVQLQKTKQSRR